MYVLVYVRMCIKLSVCPQVCLYMGIYITLLVSIHVCEGYVCEGYVSVRMCTSAYVRVYDLNFVCPYVYVQAMRVF